MLLFSQNTGELKCVLLDEAHLTNIRTAIAGAIVAKHLAPEKVEKIGIAGAGTQGRLQLQYLKDIVECRNVLVWGINKQELKQYKADMEQEGFSVETCLDTEPLQKECNLIVTSTPSKEPLLRAEHVQKGTHITAMGSDTTEKQELDSLILKNADLVVADSIEQCMERGEIFKAIEAGVFNRDRVVELGNVISGVDRGRISQDHVSVADLTGVAVQDINIASAVFRAFENSTS
jgi:ornithine cyclodeaminase